MFVLLAKRRRRLTLRILRKLAPPVPATELADRIGDRTYEDPSTDDVRAIYLTLYHNHLPRLEEADVVKYDSNVGTVSPGQNFDALVGMLERTDEQDLPWSDE